MTLDEEFEQMYGKSESTSETSDLDAEFDRLYGGAQKGEPKPAAWEDGDGNSSRLPDGETNEWGGNLRNGGRKVLFRRDENGKIEGYSTTSSMLVKDDDGRIAVIPTVVDGNELSSEEAVGHYAKTGEHWGKADDEDSARKMAQAVHDRHAADNQKPWNDYIHSHWDDMSDRIRNDPETRYQHKVRGGEETSLMERVAFGDLGDILDEKDKPRSRQVVQRGNGGGVMGYSVSLQPKNRTDEEKASDTMDELAEIGREAGLSDWQVSRIRRESKSPDEMRKNLAYVAGNRVRVNTDGEDGEGYGPKGKIGRALLSLVNAGTHAIADIVPNATRLAGTLLGGESDVEQAVMVDDEYSRKENEDFRQWARRKKVRLNRNNFDFWNEFFKWEAPIEGKEGMRESRSLMAPGNRTKSWDAKSFGDKLVAIADAEQADLERYVPRHLTGSSFLNGVEDVVSTVGGFAFAGRGMIPMVGANSYQQTRGEALKSGKSDAAAKGIGAGMAAFDAGMTALFYMNPVGKWMKSKGFRPVETFKSGSFTDMRRSFGNYFAKQAILDQSAAALEAGAIIGVQGAGDRLGEMMAQGKDVDIGDIVITGVEGAAEGVAVGLVMGGAHVLGARHAGRKYYEARIGEAVKTPEGVVAIARLNPDGTAAFCEAFERGGIASAKEVDAAGLPPMSAADRVNHYQKLKQLGISSDSIRKNTRIKDSSAENAPADGQAAPSEAPASEELADSIRKMGVEPVRYKIPTDAEGKPKFVYVAWRDNRTGKSGSSPIAIDERTGVAIMENDDGTFTAYDGNQNAVDADSLKGAVEKANELALAQQYNMAERQKKLQFIQNMHAANFADRNVWTFPTMADAVAAVDGAINDGSPILGITSVDALTDPAGGFSQDAAAFHAPDGTTVMILDNIDHPSDAKLILQQNAPAPGEGGVRFFAPTRESESLPESPAAKETSAKTPVFSEVSGKDESGNPITKKIATDETTGISIIDNEDGTFTVFDGDGYTEYANSIEDAMKTASSLGEFNQKMGKTPAPSETHENAPVSVPGEKGTTSRPNTENAPVAAPGTAGGVPAAQTQPKKKPSEKQIAARERGKKLFVERAKEKKRAENKLKTRYIEEEQRNPQSLFSFAHSNGGLLPMPQRKHVFDKKTRKFKYVFVGDSPAVEALNSFFDGLKGEEYALWRDRIFGKGAKPSDGGADTAIETLIAFQRGLDVAGENAITADDTYQSKYFQNYGQLLADFKDEYDRYDTWKAGGALSGEEREIADREAAEDAQRKAEEADENAYYLDQLANKTESDAKYDNAVGEIEKWDAGTPEIQAFNHANLAKAKDGDTIRFDHADESFDFVAFDAESGMLTLQPSGVRDNPLLSDAQRREGVVKYLVTSDGVKEIKEEPNGRENQTSASANLAGDAQGERGGEKGEGEFALESASQEELNAEAKKRRDKKEIERRQNAPLKGGTGEVGQTLMDLGGAEGEDLFNRTQKSEQKSEQNDSAYKSWLAKYGLADTPKRRAEFDKKLKSGVIKGVSDSGDATAKADAKADAIEFPERTTDAQRKAVNEAAKNHPGIVNNLNEAWVSSGTVTDGQLIVEFSDADGQKRVLRVKKDGSTNGVQMVPFFQGTKQTEAKPDPETVKTEKPVEKPIKSGMDVEKASSEELESERTRLEGEINAIPISEQSLMHSNYARLMKKWSRVNDELKKRGASAPAESAEEKAQPVDANGTQIAEGGRVSFKGGEGEFRRTYSGKVVRVEKDGSVVVKENDWGKEWTVRPDDVKVYRLNLPENSISMANSQSQFDAGDHIARTAEDVYSEGLERLADDPSWTPEQRARAEIERNNWKDLCEKSFSDEVSRRASFVPWTVSGPARYPSRTMSKRSDALIKAQLEWGEKRKRFLENARKRIYGEKPDEAKIEDYLTGRNDSPIAADNPKAVEKLDARISFLKAEHERGKAMNAWFKKNGTMVGFEGLDDAAGKRMDAEIERGWDKRPYPTWAGKNGLANIRRLEERRNQIAVSRAAGETPDRVFSWGRVETAAKENRIRLVFDDKPDAETRTMLKRNGFRWSPSSGAWQCFNTPNGKRAVERVLDSLGKAEEGTEAARPAMPKDAAKRLGTMAFLPEKDLRRELAESERHASDPRVAQKVEDIRAILSYRESVRDMPPQEGASEDETRMMRVAEGDYDKLADPRFVSWCDERKAKPTAENRVAYDTERAKEATKIVRNWIPNATVRFADRPAEPNPNDDIRYLATTRNGATKRYKTPTEAINDFISELDGIGLNDEQRGIYDVVVGNRKSTDIRKDDLNGLVKFHHGSRGKGAFKIVSVHYAGKRGPVTAQEIVDIGVVIRDGVLEYDGTADHPYSRTYTKIADDGAKLKVVVDLDKKKNESVINFYSDRKAGTTVSSANMTDSMRSMTNVSGVVNGASDIRKMIAGAGANGADAKRLSDAQAMEAAGSQPKDIWQKTGWWRGEDGKWRFELSHEKAKRGMLRIADKIVIGAGEVDGENVLFKDGSLTKTLGELARDNNPNPYLRSLFNAYPKLKDVEIALPANMNNGESGITYPDDLMIDINHNIGSEEIAKTLEHEIQHVIQHFEGFDSGSSPEEMARKLHVSKRSRKAQEAYENTPGEREARAVEERLFMTPEQRAGEMPMESLERKESGIYPGATTTPDGDWIFDNGLRLLHDENGNVAGTYNRRTNEVTLYPGADVETVAHELGGHALWQFAEQHPETGLKDKLTAFANEAPQEVKDAIADAYGEDGLTPDALLDEIFSNRFGKSAGKKLEDALNGKEGRAWYQKVWDWIKDAWRSLSSRLGGNRVDLDAIRDMAPDEAVDFIANQMVNGKTLGKVNMNRAEDYLSVRMQKRPQPAPSALMEKSQWRRDAYMRNMADRFHDILSLERDIDKNLLMPIDQKDSVYHAKRVQPGLKEMHQREVAHIADRVDGLLRANKGKIDYDSDVGLFLLAQAAPDRNRKILARTGGYATGAGMSDADAAAIMARIQGEGKMPALREFDKVRQELSSRWGLDFLVQGGMITQELADKLKAEEPFYVPMRDDFTRDDGFDMNSVRKIEAPAIKTAKGRSTVADNPMTFLFMQAADNIARVEENRTRQKLASLVRSYPGLGIGKVRNQRLVPSFDVSTGKTALVVDQLDTERENPNIVAFRENGKKKIIELYGDRGTLIANAMRGENIVRGPDWVQNFTRWWASTATQWSPLGFKVSNAIKDTIEIAINSGADHNILHTMRYVFDRLPVSSHLHGYNKTLKEYLKTGNFTGKKAARMQEFVENGGLIGGGLREGYQEIEDKMRYAKDMQKQFDAAKNKTLFVLKGILRKISFSNEMTENLSRFINYDLRREKGETIEQAIINSREDSTDFNMYGNKRWINNAWMFANSILGGSMRAGRQLEKHPLAIGGTIVAIGMLEEIADILLNGDEDEVERQGLPNGNDISEYERSQTLHLRVGDTYLRAPMHFGPYSLLKYVGNNIVRAAAGKIKIGNAIKNVADGAVTFGTHFTGFGELNFTGGLESFFTSLAPTALQPLVEIISNEDYKRSKIYRKNDSEHLKGLPNSSFAKPNTAEGWSDFAQFMNRMTGGDKYEPGLIDISPDVYKYVSEQVLKNTGKDLTQTVETFARAISSAIEGENTVELRDVPILNKIVRKIPGNEGRYYRALDEYTTMRNKFRVRADDDRKAELLEKMPYLERPSKDIRPVLDLMSDTISDLRGIESGNYRPTRQAKVAPGVDAPIDRLDGVNLGFSKSEIERIQAERRVLQAQFISLMRGGGVFDRDDPNAVKKLDETPRPNSPEDVRKVFAAYPILAKRSAIDRVVNAFRDTENAKAKGQKIDKNLTPEHFRKIVLELITGVKQKR